MAGLYVSYYADVASGPAIVLWGAVVFTAAATMRPFRAHVASES